ncbi:unnamed protein product [Arabis nemorensis]|uniref:Uncharacterized protein n=1 Tax=Arabis nemorensis TaxID=586526 RepID=A0A565AN71_9BRAS|nr:unnamed protein product [Arabis nemorensis]
MGCCLSKKSPSISLSNGISRVVKSPDPNKPMKPVPENPAIEEAKPVTIIISEKLHQEEENGSTKEVSVTKHRRSHERSEESPACAAVEKSIDSVVMSSKEEVDAILIQCGKMSRSNSAAKTRRYSGSKRSFDFDQNERIQVEVERKTHRERVNNGSPRRTPSREREDSKSYRSGSRERGNGGSRRVSRSPGKRSETNSGISVISSNIRPSKFVTVPATGKSSNGEPSIKRITVKRNIGEACRTAATSNVQPPPPSLSRSSSRKAEQSPYRRNPLGEIDQNSSKGDKTGSCNTNCNKKRENESSKPNPRKTIRASSPQVISRSRSLRKSRDFDFCPETLLLSNEDNNNNYTALLLKDIQSFHGKSNNVDDPSVSFNLLPSCVTKACSIVEAVADLNSTTSLSSDSTQFRFTSTAKKADLMEPSFEKYVTVKRGGSFEGQESSGSNNLT